jgi:NAD(P)-dependent dehydrogenase (short-subunit alcohol dehydrogenase family)
MPDLTNRIAVITGANGATGQAVARRFLAAGARLVLIDRSKGRLSAAFPELDASSDHILIDAVDVSDPAVMQWVVQQTVEHFGRLDILVNTVGGIRPWTALHQTPIEVWDELMTVNARTVFVACQAAIPVMMEQGYGKIINFASRAALSGGANAAAYSAAKSAVLRLTESMAAELKFAGINVNCVIPGRIDSPQNRQSMPQKDPSQFVAPESLAEVVLFLASDAARDIHGAAIPVYGRS